ncbi:hypothetical protein [uncultured Paludibaculum sp.]|uniref:hypothetical protein n=1 Tax=uncultured Paludibaculum sp. TaxID=1765020 RepID=UPI002AAAB1C6|nr:hypothetical protein [uncultured Paludibaculum sp.]
MKAEWRAEHGQAKRAWREEVAQAKAAWTAECRRDSGASVWSMLWIFFWIGFVVWMITGGDEARQTLIGVGFWLGNTVRDLVVSLFGLMQ